jgi:hypothetical protein
MTTSSLTQGPAARVIDLAPETRPVQKDTYGFLERAAALWYDSTILE